MTGHEIVNSLSPATAMLYFEEKLSAANETYGLQQ